MKNHISATFLSKCLGTTLVLLLGGLSNLTAQVVYDVDPAVEGIEKNRIEKSKTADKKIMGYRIFIGFSAKRADATEILTKAEEKFADSHGAVLIYDEPNFKVYVGTFATAAEADAALVDVKREFPNARKLRMLIPNPAYIGPTSN
ncbi:MAG: SPOR domain-containing protein [Bacteroidia bacterium]|nr:SPOR domain-containing protein [Bacteroidia bacterium]